MKIRLLASPPLFVAAGGEEYAVECCCRDGVGFVVASLRRDPASTISLGQVEHGGDDVRLAWREGFQIQPTEDAHELAVALVKSGLADEIHPRAAGHAKPLGHDTRGTPV